MANETHSHGDAAPHQHPGATPGHSHDAAAGTPAAAAPTAASAPVTPTPRGAVVDDRPTGGGLILRILLTLLGAGAMIVGAFQDWLAGEPGSVLEWAVLYAPRDPTGQATLATSAGGIFVLLALLALVGLAFPTGWLTRVAALLALAGWVMIVITLFRFELPPLGGTATGIGAVQIGLWVILAGSLIALIGAFFGTRRAVNRDVA